MHIVLRNDLIAEQIFMNEFCRTEQLIDSTKYMCNHDRIYILLEDKHVWFQANGLLDHIHCCRCSK
jgi:hypothetical protein